MKNLHCTSADPHIHDSLNSPCCTHIYPARTSHLDSLLDKSLLIACQYIVADCPSGATTSSGASRRIFTVIKDHSCVQSRLRVDGLAAHKIEELGIRLVQVGCSIGPEQPEIPELRQRTKRHHGERHSSRNRLDRQRWVQVSDFNS